MRRTTERLSLQSRDGEPTGHGEVATQARTRTGFLLVAFAAFSAAGLLTPGAASTSTKVVQPSVSVVLPPATVRNALPPEVAPSPAAKPSPATKPSPPAQQVSTKVLAATPAQGATNVAVGERITIKPSAPPAPGAPMPTLEPPVAGKWWVNGNTLTFVAATGYSPVDH